MSITAHGPDGVRYDALAKIDPGAKELAKLYSICQQHKLAPASWKDSRTRLVYKAGDPNEPGNWRPLSLGNTIAKLYAGVLADRITKWAVDNKILFPAQKGSLGLLGLLAIILQRNT